jgi:hypothetical protein
MGWLIACTVLGLLCACVALLAHHGARVGDLMVVIRAQRPCMDWMESEAAPGCGGQGRGGPQLLDVMFIGR